MLLLLPMLFLVASAAAETDEQRIVGLDFGPSHITSWYFEKDRPILVDRMRGSDDYRALMSLGPLAVDMPDHQEFEPNVTMVALFRGYVKHMEEIATARLDRQQKVGAFTFPRQVMTKRNSVSHSLWEVMNDGIDMTVCSSIIRDIPSNAGAALNSGTNYCHSGWMGSSDANYDTAAEVLVIQSYLGELKANYLQLTSEGPLASDYRQESIVVEGDYHALAEAIGQLHRTSSHETSAVIISGDLSSQEVDYIKSNVSQEVPSLKNKFKAPYAGPEHVSAIGSACYAHEMVAYQEQIARSWDRHDEL